LLGRRKINLEKYFVSPLWGFKRIFYFPTTSLTENALKKKSFLGRKCHSTGIQT